MWKQISEYPDYSINEFGEIKNKHGKILKQRVDGRGYSCIYLHKNKTRKFVTVHRLVGEYFVENPLGYPQLNHKDENKLNNCASNLEWCTGKYNSNYGTRTERSAKNHEKSIVVTNKDGEQITFSSIKKTASFIKCSTSTIDRHIKTGKAIEEKFFVDYKQI